MSQVHQGCAVCGGTSSSAARSKVVIQGRTFELCRAHAAVVVQAMPKTFEDLRALFAGVDLPVPARRASTSDRRSGVDRRFFPRPEGRRRSGGRRQGDPLDA